MNRAARALALAAAAVLLASCASLVRLAYSNAALAYSNLDSMAAWMIDDYVDLHTLQEDWVRDRIARVMEWHRVSELPKYRDFLRSVAVRIERPLEPADVQAHFGEVRAHYHRLALEVLPDVAEFLSNLEPSQVAHLERKFAEDNRRFVRASVRGTPAERRDRRMKRLVGHLKGWLGHVDDRQLARVEAYYVESEDFTEEMLAERRFRQSEILALARNRPPREAMLATLRHLFLEVDSWRRPEYREKVRARDARFFQLFADLSATLDDRQRRALRKRIAGLVRDIDELTG